MYPRWDGTQSTMARAPVGAGVAPGALCTESAGPSCAGENRQHGGSGICQQAKDLEIPTPLQDGTQAVDMGMHAIPVTQTHAGARAGEPGGRPALQGKGPGEWRLYPDLTPLC